uniref:Uncharacterized protein n=1 Tax=CrAss-like virus sp. ctYsL76 TaxID=2826826 RepID=A0A8S5QML8_9CAUD|nr:MAG TPA: hypothetical protein [CrAss-like virus sp. ctYsL76]
MIDKFFTYQLNSLQIAYLHSFEEFLTVQLFNHNQFD